MKLKPPLKISRRNFLKYSSIAIAGTSLNLSNTKKSQPTIKNYRILGRTGFKVSDIAMGCDIGASVADLVRYAYERGVNYFDTAERYSNGNSERGIGQALQFMDRKKVFITTKLLLWGNESKQLVLDKFRQSLKRLNTDYVDALFLHGADKVSQLNQLGFHQAVSELKAEGRIKYIGVSCHGPLRRDGQSMEKVLCAAAEDGRFDVLLIAYNFMNEKAGNNILSLCQKNNIGATAMKTAPGFFEVDSFDPNNPTADQKATIDKWINEGSSKENAIVRLRRKIYEKQSKHEQSQPFIQKYGIKSENHLQKASIQWVLSNKAMHTACISFKTFELIDKIIPISGTQLSQSDSRSLDEYKNACSTQYCRHGCNDCFKSCPKNLPVSAIMRYAYYFKYSNREKHAMEQYHQLKDRNAQYCFQCNAPCLKSCPYNFDIQNNLAYAHSLLNFV